MSHLRITVSSVAFLALLTLISCSDRLASFTILSSRNVELSGEHSIIKANVSGTDGVTWFLFVPFGSASISDAVDEILTNYNADFLTNVVIRYKYWTTILVSYEGYKITADAWRNGSAPKTGMLLPKDAVRSGREYQIVALPNSSSFQVVEK